MAAPPIADLEYLRDYFFGTLDSNGNLSGAHLKELGQALADMENGTDPVTAINAVLPSGVKIDPSAEGEVRKMFRKGTHGNPTGKIQVRETLIDLLRKLKEYPTMVPREYSTKSMIGSQPPDPWRA